MANEAEVVELGQTRGDVIDLTCDDGVAIPSGTIVAIQGNRHISGSTAVDGSQYGFGITASEKVALDGQTKIGVYTRGLFRCTMSATDEVSAGEYVCISGTNLLGELKFGGTSDTVKQVLGRAMQDIASGARGVIKLGL